VSGVGERGVHPGEREKGPSIGRKKMRRGWPKTKRKLHKRGGRGQKRLGKRVLDGADEYCDGGIVGQTKNGEEEKRRGGLGVT